MKKGIVLLLLVSVLSMPVLVMAADDGDIDKKDDESGDEELEKLEKNQAKIKDNQAELDELDKKIKELSRQHESAADEAELAADRVAYVSQELDAAELQYEQTLLNISVVDKDIDELEYRVEGLRGEMKETKAYLKKVLQELYKKERLSLLDVLLGSVNLGTLINERKAYQELQERVLMYVRELRVKERKVKDRLVELDNRQEQLQQMREVQAYQQADLAEKREEKNELLQLKQKEQARYARKISEAKEARAEVEKEIFSLRNLGVELKLDDAYQAARYASSLTGVRPSLLLGIVKVETNVGKTLGSGTFPDDMHPASREAFLRLMKKLGRDPYNTPISRRPASYKGWGGAIGPGQFLPDTWERIAVRVGALMNKETPDPFELADSLVGVGIMLADRGAGDPAREMEAIARYLAGPNWQYHLWYSKRVLAVAAEYEN